MPLYTMLTLPAVQPQLPQRLSSAYWGMSPRDFLGRTSKVQGLSIRIPGYFSLREIY